MRELFVKDAKASAIKTYSDRCKHKDIEHQQLHQKEHKNARASHGVVDHNLGHKKLSLFGKWASRQATKLELVNDALDLMDAEEAARSDRAFY